MQIRDILTEVHHKLCFINVPAISRRSTFIVAALVIMSRVMRKPDLFAYVKTKAQISCAVTAQLTIAFVFATRIV